MKTELNIWVLCGLIFLSSLSFTQDSELAPKWSTEKVWTWYDQQPWLCGFNYIPANAISYTEMWMDYAFDPNLIDQELKLAEEAGFNCLRVVLPYVVWERESSVFKKRIGQFLQICDVHGLKAIPCFFDDCVFGPITDPIFGKQPDPVKGWYANGWTPSPGHSRVRDLAMRPGLEKYVKDILVAYKCDDRVLCWDLYNEPTNSGMGNESLSLLMDVFRWAREVNPTQPLTTAVWNGNKELNTIILDNSDIVTFHNYSPAPALVQEIRQLRENNRPIICTEWLNRPRGSMVKDCLPVFYSEKVGCPLVNGKTQTHLPWGHRPGDPEPQVWQHDIYHSDLTPYSSEELNIFMDYLEGNRFLKKY